MKTIYTLLIASLATTFASAKTYTLGSGKWTDTKIWNNEYPGTTIKAEDIVIITGQVTMNTGITVEGTLTVNKGAYMLGMKDLVIAKTGTFTNNGNTVMNRIVNEGTLKNNMEMEAMSDIDNKGLIENNNQLIGGNNFTNYGGTANGKGGAYFVNNNILTSPSSNFGPQVKVFFGNALEKSGADAKVTSLFLNASLNANNGVVLNIFNPENLNIAAYRIEKSTDGSHYTLLGTITDNNSTYVDSKPGNNLTYYRVKAISLYGQEILLPVATAKTAAAPTKAFSQLD